jgi:alkanesulfonate monooxygenase SsuD/methylene tetrahydromethanopterin reductase-like flavin-dependent oxidoreductase (luciferase family)
MLRGRVLGPVRLNWATPERIATSRALIAEGAARAGRDPGDIPTTMYVRVCIDDDVAAARRAFGTPVLGYSLALPGAPLTADYRGLFDETIVRIITARPGPGPVIEAMTALMPAAIRAA